MLHKKDPSCILLWTLDIGLFMSPRGPISNMALKFILGLKGRMTTVFDLDGRSYAATVVVAQPNTITQIKTQEKEGYNAVQVGANEIKEKHANKPQVGHTKGKFLKNFREITQRGGGAIEGAEVGATIDVTAFAEGDTVEVSAISKGKGFAGVVKRHGFHGGPRSHGQKHSERSPGSIGGSGGRAGGRVAKGMRMAGRTGSDRVTVRNLKVLQVLPETGELVISGAIPGRPGTLVEIKG